MEGCLFCMIASETISADIVMKTEHTLAFRDINPQAPVHVLVIPKDHLASLGELDPASPLLSELLSALQEVARSEHLESGYRVVSNIGADGGQTVGHLHFHVLGGRAMSWPPG